LQAEGNSATKMVEIREIKTNILLYICAYRRILKAQSVRETMGRQKVSREEAARTLASAEFWLGYDAAQEPESPELASAAGSIQFRIGLLVREGEENEDRAIRALESLRPEMRQLIDAVKAAEAKGFIVDGAALLAATEMAETSLAASFRAVPATASETDGERAAEFDAARQEWYENRAGCDEPEFVGEGDGR
jgi:hypothetical protein